VVCRPMFYRDRHVGFAVNIGHWTDIGGMAPGGCAGTATHVVQEGLIRTTRRAVKEQAEKELPRPQAAT